MLRDRFQALAVGAGALLMAGQAHAGQFTKYLDCFLESDRPSSEHEIYEKTADGSFVANSMGIASDSKQRVVLLPTVRFGQKGYYAMTDDGIYFMILDSRATAGFKAWVQIVIPKKKPIRGVLKLSREPGIFHTFIAIPDLILETEDEKDPDYIHRIHKDLAEVYGEPGSYEVLRGRDQLDDTSLGLMQKYLAANVLSVADEYSRSLDFDRDVGLMQEKGLDHFGPRQRLKYMFTPTPEKARKLQEENRKKYLHILHTCAAITDKAIQESVRKARSFVYRNNPGAAVPPKAKDAGGGG